MPINEKGIVYYPQYDIVQHCGSGAYGDVYKVQECTGRCLALKKIDKKRVNINWETEFLGVKNYTQLYLNHPHLISIYHVFIDENYFYYLLELADNTSLDPNCYIPDTLQARIEAKKLPFDHLEKLAVGLFDAIETLHAHGIVHHDIKPQNIIYVQGQPKLSDIGLCSQIFNKHDLYGTKGFLPPEITNPTHQDKMLLSTPELDLYAFGKLLYTCLTFQNANDFPSINVALLLDKKRLRMNQLCIQLCNANPQERLTKHEKIKEQLNQIFHPKKSFFIQYQHGILTLVFF